VFRTLSPHNHKNFLRGILGQVPGCQPAATNSEHENPLALSARRVDFHIAKSRVCGKKGVNYRCVSTDEPLERVLFDFATSPPKKFLRLKKSPPC
jgi:hypothetical protein